MTSPSDLDQLLHQATAAATGALHRRAPTLEGPSGDGLDAELPPGTRLDGGRFVVRGVLGRGGFGITYEAFDHRLERPVAVKELFPGPVVRRGRHVVAPAHAAESFAEAKARFLREASVLARFSHPGIVRIYEVLEENATAYLVMERLDGRSLATLQVERQGAPFAEPEVVAIAARCGSALAVLHRDGVLHRDLNPSNVVITGDGRVVIIDFGLAREFTGDAGGPMTRMVTPGYAPPEQYRGEGQFGPASDVYGLAATLYRLLTGIAPVAALDRQSGVELPAPARLNGSVSKPVSDGIMDGLELVAAHRPADMPSFLARLALGPRPATTGAVRIGPPVPAAPPPARPSPPPSRAQAAATRSPASPPVKVVVPAPLVASASTALRPMTPPYPLGPQAAASDPTVRPVGLPPPPAPPPSRVPGRWKVVVPIYAALAAAGAAAPVLINVVLAVLILPAVAAAGDVVVQSRQRRRMPAPRRRRLPLPIYATGRFVRNLVSMAWTGVPALIVAGVLVAATLLLDGSGVDRPAQDWVLRAGGAGVALLLADGVLGNRVRYRAAVMEDVVRPRLLARSGRLTRAGWMVVAAAVVLTLLAVAWRPDLWPLPG